MNNWIDYHVHSDNSHDCHVSMATMCAAAISRGVTEIAFTDHFNSHILDVDLGFYDPDRYFAGIERCRSLFPALVIRAGVEVGEPHRWRRKILPVLERYPYDLVMGSLHWYGDENVFDPNYFRARSPAQAFGLYFKELTQMVEEGGFEILAHIDLPKRTGFDVYGEFDIRDYEATVRQLWAACIAQNITPEINTKGLRCTVKQLHPTVDALRWYVEMGGRLIALGSDAHHQDNIGGNFKEARDAAKEAGLEYVSLYQKRSIVSSLTL